MTSNFVFFSVLLVSTIRVRIRCRTLVLDGIWLYQFLIIAYLFTLPRWNNGNTLPQGNNGRCLNWYASSHSTMDCRRHKRSMKCWFCGLLGLNHFTGTRRSAKMSAMWMEKRTLLVYEFMQKHTLMTLIVFRSEIHFQYFSIQYLQQAGLQL